MTRTPTNSEFSPRNSETGVEAARLCRERGRATIDQLLHRVIFVRARRMRVKFIQRYRSYVINYNLGEDMVKQYIEKRSGNDPEKRWSEFGKLLASPRLPSSL